MVPVLIAIQPAGFSASSRWLSGATPPAACQDPAADPGRGHSEHRCHPCRRESRVFSQVPAVRCATVGFPLRTFQVQGQAANPIIALLGLLFLAATPSALADDRASGLVVESMTTVLIRQTEIPAREAGVLASLMIEPGELVTDGQLLGSLDDERQVIAVRAAELNLVIAQLKADNELPVETARALIREAEQQQAALEVAAKISSQLAASDVAIRLTQKSREVAQFELDRAQKARDAFSSSVSSAELNRLQVLFDQKTLEIEKANEDRSITLLKPQADQAAVAGQAETVERSRLMAAQEERLLQVARAGRDVAENELALAKLQLDRRRFIAPFVGTIVAVEQQSGEWVESGTTVLRIIQLDRLRVEGFIDATIAAESLSGRTVMIRFTSASSLPEVEGRITFVSPEIDSLNQQVRIRAEFDNPGHRIRPGLVASMKIGGPVAVDETR